MEPEDLDLGALVLRAQRGDVDAFDRIYLDVQPRLLRYLRTLVGDEAEDVASEAWLQIARDLGKFSGDSAGFRGWTARIARNRAMDLLRRRQRRPVEPVPLDRLVEFAGYADGAEQLVLDELSTDAAVRLIASLPRDQAEAVVLRVLFELDAAGAGRVLGKRAGAVRTAAYRGLRNLAKRLELISGEPVTRRVTAALEDTA
ncbi:RNA polymerase sigma factor [Actinocorallia populi]|uniref:RNA polymerase sigma factor n=1 Tax=Actinocorallia populi TaxID=2079200 RepID=UPI000D08D2FB|nr:RNA polymerase sigma factor [Actinocorallia populi]